MPKPCQACFTKQKDKSIPEEQPTPTTGQGQLEEHPFHCPHEHGHCHELPGGCRAPLPIRSSHVPQLERLGDDDEPRWPLEPGHVARHTPRHTGAGPPCLGQDLATQLLKRLQFLGADSSAAWAAWHEAKSHQSLHTSQGARTARTRDELQPQPLK